MTDVIVRAFDWCFRSRRTGRVTIAQWPNLALWMYIAASIVRALADPRGSPRTVLTVVATAALVWWAIDELLRGVNPWRRFLGALIIASTAWQL